MSATIEKTATKALATIIDHLTGAVERLSPDLTIQVKLGMSAGTDSLHRNAFIQVMARGKEAASFACHDYDGKVSATFDRAGSHRSTDYWAEADVVAKKAEGYLKRHLSAALKDIGRELARKAKREQATKSRVDAIEAAGLEARTRFRDSTCAVYRGFEFRIIESAGIIGYSVDNYREWVIPVGDLKDFVDFHVERGIDAGWSKADASN